MKYKAFLSCLPLVLTISGAHAADRSTPHSMGYEEYVEKSAEIRDFRQERLLGISAALDMAGEHKALFIDVRDPDLYRQQHIQGAINLSVAEITEENLAKIVPSKNTPIILYCNEGISLQPTRMVAASSMAYPAFYVHGYRNLYELKPLWDQENAQQEYDMIPFKQDKD